MKSMAMPALPTVQPAAGFGKHFHSIRWKLTAAIVSVALILAFAEQVFFANYDKQNYPRTIQKKMQVLARVLGNNSTSALKFRSRPDALEVLSSLRGEPSIRSAYLFDDKGKVVAEYLGRGERLEVPLISLDRDKIYFEKDALVVLQRIISDNVHIGSILITSNLDELTARQTERISIGLQVGFGLVALAILFAFVAQRFFTEPIRDMLEITSSITQAGNYALRAPRKRNDEFGLLIDQFNEMVGEIERRDRDLKKHVALLERSNRELDQFVYAASHDLKAPLRAVDNLSSLIDRATAQILPPEKREYLELMHGRIKRMEALIDDLLQYSRVGRVQVSIEQVDTAKLVHAVVDLLSPPKQFVIDISSDLPLLRTPKAPLEQVFRNLIGNAVKHHTKPDGRIEVRSKDAGDMIEFSVSDDGPGIAPEYHEKVFQMFQTLKSRDDVEGSGMGLALVKKIVETHGGQVILESAEGKGSMFIFTWPKTVSEEK